MDTDCKNLGESRYHNDLEALYEHYFKSIVGVNDQLTKSLNPNQVLNIFNALENSDTVELRILLKPESNCAKFISYVVPNNEKFTNILLKKSIFPNIYIDPKNSNPAKEFFSKLAFGFAQHNPLETIDQISNSSFAQNLILMLAGKMAKYKGGEDLYLSVGECFEKASPIPQSLNVCENSLINAILLSVSIELIAFTARTFIDVGLKFGLGNSSSQSTIEFSSLVENLTRAGLYLNNDFSQNEKFPAMSLSSLFLGMGVTFAKILKNSNDFDESAPNFISQLTRDFLVF